MYYIRSQINMVLACLSVLLMMASSQAQDTAIPPIGSDEGPDGSADDRPLAVSPDQSDILGTILDHQRQREERIAELEARSAANEAMLHMMRREALAVDLLFAQTRDAAQLRPCTAAIAFAEEIMRQIQQTQSWIGEIEQQCSLPGSGQAFDQMCGEYLEHASNELARLIAIDVSLPDQCADTMGVHNEEFNGDLIDGVN